MFLSIGRYLLVLSIFQISLTDRVSEKIPIKKYFFKEINSWSKCSTTCGDGFQEKQRACFKMSRFLIENVAESMCKDLPGIITSTKTCNYGDCVKGNVWKTTEWGKCSTTCGNEGGQTREVECFNAEDRAIDPENCDEQRRPESSRNCYRFDCPPNFFAKKWSACDQSDACSPGTQRRELRCISLLENGTILNLPSAACYIRGLKPPSSWKKCYDNFEQKKCSDKVLLNPIIATDQRMLVQMRRVKRLNLQVGQISYIILGTRLTLNCPVKNFLPSSLIWIHRNVEYIYKGKSNNRLRVTRRGKLIVKSFLVQDQGIWKCKAGNKSAEIVIKLKSPSEGFKDWAIRNSIWNKEMPNEDLSLALRKKEIVIWVTGQWTQCSVSCEGNGIQSRMVKCEHLENRYYYQLEENECLKQLDSKPPSQQKCLGNYPCPKWELKNLNRNKCSDSCINYGKASLTGDLECIFKNISVDFDMCQSNKKPIIECPNPACIAKWKISQWTKCSRSCGKSGIQARYLMCVWKTTELPAGDVCYKTNVSIPNVVKSCNPPNCNLKCVDMHPNCGKRPWNCRIGIYSYRCCKTCRAYFRELQKKP